MKHDELLLLQNRQGESEDAANRAAAFSSFGGLVAIVIVVTVGSLVVVQTNRHLKELELKEKLIITSLEEKEVLLQEIHHRVKNNLQLISSMLLLQANTTTDRLVLDALSESQRRIQVIARLHESLHRSDNLAFINAREFIQTLVDDTMASISNDTTKLLDINLDVDDMTISVDRAIIYGQIVSELISNSLKHAFPAVEKVKLKSLYIKLLGKD